MKTKLLLSLLLTLLFFDLIGQTWPMVINNTPITGTPLGIRCNSSSNTFLAQVSVGKKFVASAVVPGLATLPSQSPSGQTTNYFYKIDLPGTLSSGSVQAYIAAGSTFTNPVCSAQIVTITYSTLYIRPSAGNLGSTNADHVNINGVSSAWAVGFIGQKFAVVDSTYFGGTLWYQIDLPDYAPPSGSTCGSPNYCSQPYGWVSEVGVTSSFSGTNGLPTPNYLNSSAPTSSGATLNWGMNYYPYNTTFSIINSGTGGTVDLVANSSSSAYTPTNAIVTSLLACTPYNVYVKASLPGGTCISYPSSTSSFTTTCCSGPLAPSMFSASSITSTSFTANWGSSFGATSYYLEVSTSSSFATTIFSANVGNVLSYPLSGLSCGSVYYYRVKAANGSCFGPLSSYTSLATGSCCTPPSAPSIFSPTGIMANSFFANWSGVGTATNYYLDVSTNTGFSSFVGGYNNLFVSGGTTSYPVTGLSCGTNYYYRVRSNNICSSSNSSTMPVSTGPCCPMPLAPVANLAKNVTATAFQPNWNTVTGATGYYIDVSTSSTFTGGFLPGYIDRFVGNVTYISLTSLTYNVTYYYRIRANNTCGSGASSAIIGVTTNPTVPNNTFIIRQEQPAGKNLEPVNIATGSYEYKHTDFNIPSGKSTLKFTRYYNSVNNTLNGDLGYGWSHNYDFYVQNFADTLWVAHYGDGHNCYFIPLSATSNNSYPLFNGAHETLSKDASTGNFILTFKMGEEYRFNVSGALESITDLNGNITTLTYTSGNLTSITAPGGRALSLSYTGSVLTLSEPGGRTVVFTKDGAGNLTQVANAASGLTKFTYSGAHLIKDIVTPRGDTLLTNTYDGSNRVIAQTDALHNLSTIQYNTPSAGDATITYPGDHSVIMHHDQYSRLTSETDELGHVRSFAYDYNCNLDSATNENGKLSRFTHDANGNMLLAIQPTGNTSTLLYNTLNRPVSIHDPAGNTDSMVYDANGNVTRIFLPNGGQLKYFYNSAGLPDSTHDAMGNASYYHYNTAGDLTSISTPSGTRSFAYDGSGRLVALTNENNATTQYQYYGNDKIRAIIDPYQDTIRYTYDADDNVIAVKDKKGFVTTLQYDIKSRLKRIQYANGGVEAFGYDSRDNVIADTNANGNIVTYGYDAKRRLASVTNALGTLRLGYDGVGNRTSDTDALGNVRLYHYDDLNRADSIRDALGNHTALLYDALGQVSKVRDPMGRATQYHYNPIGLMDSVLDALHHNTSVTYDLNGNLTRLSDPKAHVQTYRYNASLRLTSVNDAAGIADSLVYDAAGNVIMQRKLTGTIARTYDSLNRITHIANTGGNNYDYTYDANDNLTAAHNNSGTATFVFDSMNRLKRYIDTHGDTVSYTYDALGNKKAIRYPGGIQVCYHYNGANLMDSVTDWLGNVTSYTYDANGRLRLRINPHSDTCKYSYDNAGQLVSLTNVIGSQVVSREIFTLNANGEKTAVSIDGPRPKHLRAQSYAHEYSNTDLLVSDSLDSYENDLAGNRRRKILTSGNISDSFSVDNFLLYHSDTTGTISYQYDALGNRIVRIKGGQYRRFIHDLSGGLPQVLVEMDSAGAIKANYVYGLGLISRIDSAGDVSFYYFDAQHNTVALSDDSGHVTDTYVYEPFGTMLQHTGNTDQPYTYVGEFGVAMETPTLYYMRARYYDAANHRFFSKDPYPLIIDNPQTINRYVYVLNNPLSKIDPTGLYVNTDPKWGIYSNEHPYTAGIVAGIGNFVASTVNSIGFIAMHPIETAKGAVHIYAGGIAMMLDDFGIHNQLGQNFREESFEKFESIAAQARNGDTYTRTSILTEQIMFVLPFDKLAGGQFKTAASSIGITDIGIKYIETAQKTYGILSVGTDGNKCGR